MGLGGKLVDLEDDVWGAASNVNLLRDGEGFVLLVLLDRLCGLCVREVRSAAARVGHIVWVLLCLLTVVVIVVLLGCICIILSIDSIRSISCLVLGLSLLSLGDQYPHEGFLISILQDLNFLLLTLWILWSSDLLNSHAISNLDTTGYVEHSDLVSNCLRAEDNDTLRHTIAHHHAQDR